MLPYPPLSIGARTVDGGQSASWAGENLRWPASACAHRTGERGGARDHPDAKVNYYRVISAWLLAAWIARIVAAWFHLSTGTFVQMRQHMRAPPCVGHVRAGCAIMGHASLGREAELPFLFPKKIRNNFIFYILSWTLKININSHGCLKIVKPILLGS